MSLINKMLQDLDARGSAPGAAGPQDLKSVVRQRPAPPGVLVGAVVAVTLVTAAGAALWWTKRPGNEVTIGPGVSAPIRTVQAIPPPVPADEPLVEALPPAPELVLPEEAPEVKPEPARESAEPVKPARVVRAAPVPAKAPSPATAAVRLKPEPGRQMTARQRAESAYNRAMASLQDGRVNDAMAALEQAIAIDPRHDAARQTLVGLLVEAGRKGPAMRALQNGLTLDPRQPSMAMLLARLQIEGGTAGIDTLMRTLPYAQGNGEYHAFLAAALARDERHREAAAQYQAALRSMPSNGVWWMGLGVSMQADQRIPEALAAFERARAAPNLTPQLRTFVERRLELLSR